MYKRVLLKLSGEILSGEGKKGFDEKNSQYFTQEIKKIRDIDINVGIVIGAGNFFRGKELKDFKIQIADQLGMLGTVINSIFLKNVLEKNGLKSVVFSKIVDLPSVMPLRYDLVEDYISSGHIVIFAGGTSNPLFTTDTAAALRAIEMDAEVLIKATKVDGIYNKDPKIFSDVVKYDRITYEQAISEQLKVMDTESFSICERNNLPIIILNFFEEDSLLKAVKGEKVGTLVCDK
ncbi:UMP kinase [Petrotoga sp. 9PWA.NaAc.5.4]|uniref:UMP kinase n=1 Tax=Petrotoga sp. 9PWA.NaAc.5.4 TaxID=1434328 RepID=UPI000CA92667|nr:UMP kinase [Petrotoga sp. 9PWA.NaAc.5.4]PNR92794.1 uridylate kinase [Petrotoga sp. 9PWA.NaAc.5.4]